MATVDLGFGLGNTIGANADPDDPVDPLVFGSLPFGIQFGQEGNVLTDANTGTTVVQDDGSLRSCGLRLTSNGGIPSNATIDSVGLILQNVIVTNLEDQCFIDAVTVIEETVNYRIQTRILTGPASTTGTLGPFDLPVTTLGEPWTPALLEQNAYGILADCTKSAGGSFIIRFAEVRVRVAFTQAPPFVSTAAASQIAEESARLNAAVDPNGASNEYPVQVYFRWGTDPEDLSETSDLSANIIGDTDQLVGVNLEGLTQKTTYYFRAIAVYDGIEIEADNVESFTTSPRNVIVRTF